MLKMMIVANISPQKTLTVETRIHMGRNIFYVGVISIIIFDFLLFVRGAMDKFLNELPLEVLRYYLKKSLHDFHIKADTCKFVWFVANKKITQLNGH